ncbi:MAG: RIP metalloprotease RseP [Chloroflexota bacterium]|nr:RIP metalloprotease RseP [Chloroflexota bacterium]
MFDFLLDNQFLSAVVAFVLVLIPAVFVHELGHFLAAKSVGITILEFGIGFPPRMIKLFSAGGTDYTLNWLPLGGFVRPLGEDMVRQMGEEAVAADRIEANARGVPKTMSVNEARPLARIWFLVAGALVNFLFAIVLFTVHGLSGVVQPGGALVSAIQIDGGSALAEAGVLPGDAIIGINGDVSSDSGVALIETLTSSDVPLTLDVVRFNPTDGSEQRLSLDYSADARALQDASVHPIITQVAADSPADSAGMLPDDLVTAFNGAPVDSVETLQRLTGASLDQVVTLTVLRAGEEVILDVTPRSNPPAGQGSMGVNITQAQRSATLGLIYQEEVQRIVAPLPFGEAVVYGFNRVGDFFAGIIALPGELLRGDIPAAALTPVGPVGISMLGADLLRDSINGVQTRGINLIEFMALISLSLGLTNLLPIPALDGGRVLFVLIEVVRGRPIAPEREGMVHLVGLALLLSLMVVVMINDVVNPITNALP